MKTETIAGWLRVGHYGENDEAVMLTGRGSDS